MTLRTLGTNVAALGNAFVTQSQVGILASAGNLPTPGTDAGPTLNTLLAAADAAKVPLILPAGATTTIGTAITPPNGTRLDLNGGTLLTDPAAGSSFRMLNVDTKSDVRIYNGTLDGNKAAYATSTEQRHNIRLANSQRIVLADVLTKNAKGDGLYIGDDVTGACSDILLINVRGESNHRNGLSLTAVNHFRQYGGWWRSNSGTSPMCGVDIEPNTDAALLDDIKFVDVDFSSNGFDGANVQAKSATPSVVQGNVEFLGCTASNNGSSANPAGTTGNGLVVRWANNVKWHGGNLKGNVRNGAYLRDTLVNIDIDTTIESNGRRGVGQGAGVNDNITDLRVAGYIWGNGTETSNSYDGVDLAGTGTRLKFRATSGGSSQRYGLRTSANWSQVSISPEARFPSNTTGTVSLSDAISSRGNFSPDTGVRVGRPNTTDVVYAARTGTDTADRWYARGDGSMLWGDGTSAVDTRLYRKAAAMLGTDQPVFLANQGSTPATQTGGGVLYTTGGVLQFVDASGTVYKVAPADPAAALNVYGIIRPLHAGLGTGQVTIGTANNVRYYRVTESGTISKIRVSIGTSSGNICVAAYSNTGSGLAAAPGTRLATSGSVASPGTGVQDISLGASVDLSAGDWIAVGADNTTVTFSGITGSGDGNLTAGLVAVGSTFPAPNTPTVSYGNNRLISCIGVP